VCGIFLYFFFHLLAFWLLAIQSSFLFFFYLAAPCPLSRLAQLWASYLHSLSVGAVLLACGGLRLLSATCAAAAAGAQVLISGPACVTRWPAGWHRLAWHMQPACATSVLATWTR
jgi:hypothetical protein